MNDNNRTDGKISLDAKPDLPINDGSDQLEETIETEQEQGEQEEEYTEQVYGDHALYTYYCNWCDEAGIESIIKRVNHRELGVSYVCFKEENHNGRGKYFFDSREAARRRIIASIEMTTSKDKPSFVNITSDNELDRYENTENFNFEFLKQSPAEERLGAAEELKRDLEKFEKWQADQREQRRVWNRPDEFNSQESDLTRHRIKQVRDQGRNLYDV